MRHLFGGTPADLAMQRVGNAMELRPGVVGTVWTQATGGTQLTDLTDLANISITQVTADTNAGVAFYGPDGVALVYVDFGYGVRYLLAASDLADIITTGLAAKVDSAGGEITGALKVTGPLTTGAGRVSVLAWNNVKEFGAVGDGTTDDTAAIQAAIDAGGGGVYFPPGVYLSGRLEMRLGTVLIGSQQSNYAYPTPPTRSSTIKVKGGVNDHLIHGSDGIANVQIRNLGLDGNKANNTGGNLINLDTASNQDTAWHIVDCYLNNAPYDGIYIGTGRQAVKIHRTWIMQSGHNGVSANGADSGLSSVLIGLSGNDGVNIAGSAWVSRLTDCDIWSSTGTGVNVNGSVAMVSIIGCGIDRNKKHGLYVGDTATAVTVYGCHFHSNSQQTDAGYPNLQMSSTGEMTANGNTFGSDAMTNMPNHNIEVYSGTLHEIGNITLAGSHRNGYIYVQAGATCGSTISGNLGVTGAVTASSTLAVTGALTAGAGLVANSGNVTINTVGRTLTVKEGTNAKMGVATLAAGVATVSTTAVTATSRIFLTEQTTGGTPGFVRVSARTAGTNFTITSSSTTDTSTVAWLIVDPS